MQRYHIIIKDNSTQLNKVTLLSYPPPSEGLFYIGVILHKSFSNNRINGKISVLRRFLVRTLITTRKYRLNVLASSGMGKNETIGYKVHVPTHKDIKKVHPHPCEYTSKNHRFCYEKLYISILLVSPCWYILFRMPLARRFFSTCNKRS